MPAPSPKAASHFRVAVAIVLLALVCALPWFRNHDRLHDFNDYALVMSAVGRLDAGERPYVDFVTPVQAGYLQLNRWVEHIGGHDYLGLTLGALLLVVAATVTLAGMLVLRWPGPFALVLTGTIVACTASQHTILWYNTLGACCLAASAWAAAVAPRLSRAHLGWHATLAAALILGGLTKVSFQAVALGAVASFAIRDALLHPKTWRRSAGLVGVAVGCGVVVPIGIEVLSTGASLSQWWHNVLGLAAQDRVAYIAALGSLRFYLEPRHDYYGPLALPQVGAILVAVFGTVTIAGWRGRSRLDRGLLVTATLGFAFAALALLATNHEIAYVGLGTGLALAAALGLAFLPGQSTLLRHWSTLGVLVLLGVAGWTSAYQGQRSQLGRSTIPRDRYVVVPSAPATLRYIAGVYIPPDLAASLRALPGQLPPPSPDGTLPVLFTGGLEWLDRVWKPVRIPGLPLWFAHGTSAGLQEERRLRQEIAHPERIRSVVASVPWDFRTPELDRFLLSRSDPPQLLGDFIRIYRLRTNRSVPSDPLHRLNAFGSNYDPALLELGPDTSVLPTPGKRPVIGTTAGSASFVFRGRAGRLAATALLRPRTVAIRPGKAVFRAEEETEAGWHTILLEKAELPVGTTGTEWPFELDVGNRPVRFSVTTADADATDLEAGWFAPTIVHGPPDDRPPPRLFEDAQDDDAPLPEEDLVTLFNCAWRPDAILTRGATPTPNGFSLKPGGQVWLKVRNGLAALEGTACCPGSPEGETPVLRIVWAAGDRIEILNQFGLGSIGEDRRFQAWAPGVGGWIGIVCDPNYATAPVRLKIDLVDTGR